MGTSLDKHLGSRAEPLVSRLLKAATSSAPCGSAAPRAGPYVRLANAILDASYRGSTPASAPSPAPGRLTAPAPARREAKAWRERMPTLAKMLAR